MKYTCEQCNYITDHKTKYERHINSNRHQSNVQTTPKSPLNNPKVTPNNPKVTFEQPQSHPESSFCCEYCGSKFKYKQGMYRHIKYTCKKSKDEDLIEFVTLLNEELQEQKSETKQIKKDIEKRDRAIAKLTKKLDIVRVGGNMLTNSQNHSHNKSMKNSMNTVNNTQHITILNHKDTDISHLTSEDYKKIVGRKANCIPEMIRRIHCDTEHPENMNIYIPNIKNGYIMVYECGDWKLKNRNRVLEDLIEEKTCMLEEWIDKSPDDEMKKKFEKYMEYRDSNYENLTNEIKSQVEMDLYNIKSSVRRRVGGVGGNR